MQEFDEMEKKLVFSVHEYSERLRRVNEKMKDCRLDFLIIQSPENIYYLTGYRSAGYTKYGLGGGVLVVPADGDPWLVGRGADAVSARDASWINNITSYAEGESPFKTIAKLHPEVRRTSRRIGIEEDCRFFTYATFKLLRKILPHAHFKDCSGLVETFRLIKSDAEIELIRKAAAISVKGIKAGVRAACPGVTDNEVAAEVYHALLSNGSEYPGYPPFVTSGSVGHTTWEGRTLKAGDIMLLELSACVKRYHAPMARTVAIGEPSSKIQKIAELTRAALEDTIAGIRPGATVNDIEAISLRKRVDTSCYSVGIAFPPTWNELPPPKTFRDVLTLGGTSTIRKGMVFHVIPNVQLEGIGAVACSETVLVTDQGREVLTGGIEDTFIVTRK